MIRPFWEKKWKSPEYCFNQLHIEWLTLSACKAALYLYQVYTDDLTIPSVYCSVSEFYGSRNLGKLYLESVLGSKFALLNQALLLMMRLLLIWLLQYLEKQSWFKDWNYKEKNTIINSYYCACWWPGTSMCQAICSYSDDKVWVMYIYIGLAFKRLNVLCLYYLLGVKILFWITKFNCKHLLNHYW